MRFCAPAVFLFLFTASAAQAKIAYDIPIEWARIETHGDYEEAYQTSLDPAKRVFVLIRGVNTEGVGVLEWATSQSQAMKRQGVNTGSPLEERFGEIDWWYIDWEDPLSGEGGRRYFHPSGDRLAEVSLLAREDVFRITDASQFDAFMASFSG